MLSSLLLILALIQGQAAAPAPTPVLVTIQTELGAIVVEVDPAKAPLTAANFLGYVDKKFYDGGVINRSVRRDNTTRHDHRIAHGRRRCVDQVGPDA